MRLGWILFSLDGRLNRKPYWIVGILFLIVVFGVGIASAVIGAQMMQASFETGDPIEPALDVVTYLPLAVGLLFLYPSVALMVKRFHDLGKTGKWVLLLLIPVLGKLATDMLGFTGQQIPLSELAIDGTESFLQAWQKGIAAELRIRPAEFAVDLFTFVVTVWFLIELGFFRGSKGPNRYGPDPLAGVRRA